MSANQDNTGGNTSSYEISAIISDPSEAVAMYKKVVEATGCTTVIAEFIPAPDDQGVEQSETGTVSVGAANPNVSVENPSAENYSSTEK
ncbi:uncharacterized protein FMAN_09941 [Fusarium mangiferae]|uniref:Uncharacterized protein n=1 Tax=Fusarium mangiferae TaxID=192010 RepID=A0A1L7TYR1_FUSMA|nr:uncharacterized protein FMAN_09941 [Fusarium mangiferae]CVL00527.1 uncharacterized protein FMAN_09941 [Fusarium mangiferae]